jgi:NADPH-dependent curcumin reductase CurA
VVAGDAVGAVDRVYPLEEAPAAFARLAAGDNLGKILIEMP